MTDTEDKKTTRKKKTKPGLIFERIAKIMEEVPAIGKDGKFDGGKGGAQYDFRSIDQVYDVLHGLLAKHKVFFTPHVEKEDRQILDRFDRQTGNKIGHTVLTCLYVTYKMWCADDGSCMPVGPIPGEAKDYGDKASGKAMSLAMKCGLLQTFCIPIHVESDFDEDPAEKVDDFLKDKAANGKGSKPKAKVEPKAENGTVEFRKAANELAQRDLGKLQLQDPDYKAIGNAVVAMGVAKNATEAAAWLKEHGQLKTVDMGNGEIGPIEVIPKVPETTTAQGASNA